VQRKIVDALEQSRHARKQVLQEVEYLEKHLRDAQVKAAGLQDKHRQIIEGI
jgi:hypothetical protein